MVFDYTIAVDSLGRSTLIPSEWLDSGDPPRSKSVGQVGPQNPVKPSYYGSPDPLEYSFKHNLGFVESNVVKYVTRWKQKGGVIDLKKARECLDRLIKWEESK